MKDTTHIKFTLKLTHNVETGTERKEMLVWIVVEEWEEWEFSVCGYWMLVTWWKCSVGGLISRSVSSSSSCCCNSSSSNCSSGGSKWYD